MIKYKHSLFIFLCERGFINGWTFQVEKHSKKKNAQDAKRGKIFMKAAKDIYIVAKEGGADPETNPALRLAIDKAKAQNMPNENIERNIKRLQEHLMV